MLFENISSKKSRAVALAGNVIVGPHAWSNFGNCVRVVELHATSIAESDSSLSRLTSSSVSTSSQGKKELKTQKCMDSVAKISSMQHYPQVPKICNGPIKCVQNLPLSLIKGILLNPVLIRVLPI